MLFWLVILSDIIFVGKSSEMRLTPAQCVWFHIYAFMDSQFKYFPIIWTFHSRHTNSRVNRLIDYMREVLELFMLATFQYLTNYLIKKNLSVFTIKIFRDCSLKFKRHLMILEQFKKIIYKRMYHKLAI